MTSQILHAVQGCFEKTSCGTEVSIAVAIIVGIAGLIATLRTTRGSNRRLAESTRLAALPILEVIFNRAPDKVILRNASQSAAASRAFLQGFRFSWNDDIWRCTFEITGAIAPSREIALQPLIQREPLSPTHEESVPSTQMFTTAFRRALWTFWPDMVLQLYVEDMLKNCYRSNVRIDFVEFDSFMGPAGDSEMRPEVSNTTLIGDLPSSLELLDRTASMHGAAER